MTMKRVKKKSSQKSPLHSDSNLSRIRAQGQGEVDSAEGAQLQNHCWPHNTPSLETRTSAIDVQEYEISNRSFENLFEVDTVLTNHHPQVGIGNQVRSSVYQNAPVVGLASGSSNVNNLNHTDKNSRKREKMGIFKNLRRKFSSLSVRKAEVGEAVSYGHIEEQQPQNSNLEFGLHTRLKERATNDHLPVAARCECSPKSHFKTFMSPKFSEWHSNTDHRDVEIAKDKPGCFSKDISRFNSSVTMCKSGGRTKSEGLDCGTSSSVNCTGTGLPKGDEKHCRTEPLYELADCVEYDPVKEQTRIWSPKVWSLTQELFRLSKFGWYWGPITRNEAEDKLTNQPDGAFLVRDSSDERYLLSLSFRSFGRTLHTRIEHCNGMFSFYAQPDTEGYPSIVDLIERSMNDSQTGIFYYSRSRSPEADQIPVRLTKPVSRFTQVQSLQHMCRFVIRQYTRYDHIQQLPLPNSLKGWIEENQYWAVS